MKKGIYILSIFFAGLMFSCTETLQLEPVSEISTGSFWKTESDVQAVLAGMYTQLRSMASPLYVWGELRSDVEADNVGAAVMEIWYKNDLTPLNSGSSGYVGSLTWAGFYGLIHSCNLILKYGPAIDFALEKKKNNSLAQAYTMRAFAYFVMARTWGGVPLMTEPVSGKLDDIMKPRASVEEVFTLIKDDITKAESLFSENSFANGRGMWSLPSLCALKAEVYLWTGKRLNGGDADITKALEACNKVQQSDVALLSDFSSIFDMNNKKSKEIIFAISRSFEETPSDMFIYQWMAPAEIMLPVDVDAETVELFKPYAGQPFMQPSVKARNMFQAGDKRKDATFHEVFTYLNPDGVKTFHSSYLMKFRGSEISGMRYYLEDYILYRYADVLLLQAEAKNALGQDPSAEINEVRQRAFGDDFAGHAFVNGSREQNDVEILDERLRELMFEGKRWWDLIRFGKALEYLPTLNGQADKLLFPIPIETLTLNNKLVQNPGYN